MNNSHLFECMNGLIWNEIGELNPLIGYRHGVTVNIWHNNYIDHHHHHDCSTWKCHITTLSLFRRVMYIYFFMYIHSAYIELYGGFVVVGNVVMVTYRLCEWPFFNDKMKQKRKANQHNTLNITNCSQQIGNRNVHISLCFAFRPSSSSPPSPSSSINQRCGWILHSYIYNNIWRGSSFFRIAAGRVDRHKINVSIHPLFLPPWFLTFVDPIVCLMWPIYWYSIHSFIQLSSYQMNHEPVIIFVVGVVLINHRISSIETHSMSVSIWVYDCRFIKLLLHCYDCYRCNILKQL